MTLVGVGCVCILMAAVLVGISDHWI